ncbi:mediator of RNA polymerase II transcription subunit 17-like [Zingiber officinale]|uniref:mediator of RNA polymerase II transcription subunit 17-like n=1 Tax=Zingiber officinale TaxID=94328 RepID=UPI001C4DA03B|nr:mediator of RNA polymerase II transcription subunit 17-like [Zingiber officinale]
MEEGGRRRISIDLDRLPIKRLDAIDEIGNEQFPPDVSHEEKRLGMIRRIDFSSIVADSVGTRKKQKTTPKEAAPAPQQAWPWQGFVENLQLAHQELSVIIDLINTVEANDAVAVSGMQRPKQLPNETLSDLAVSAATKLQRLRNLGRYFKQSSKALELKVSREARFYGSLIRLQQHWKLKRQRVLAGPGSDGFSFDLLDNTSSDTTMLSRPLPNALVRIVRENAGLLAIQRPPKSFRCISISYTGTNFSSRSKKPLKGNIYNSVENPQANKKEALTDEDVNSWVKDTHSVLREIHQSIFLEQVFDRVNHESYCTSPGIHVTGMLEDLLQLAVGQDTSICMSLVSVKKEDDFLDSRGLSQKGNNGFTHSDSSALVVNNEKDEFNQNNLEVPSPVGLEIYLVHIFHKNSLVRLKEKNFSASRVAVTGHAATESCGLTHFCKTVAHRIFSTKVLAEIERLVSRIPYVQLLSHPPWHSRTSSWSLFLKFPESVFHTACLSESSNNYDVKGLIRPQIHTKIVVKDDQVTVSGEGALGTLCSFGISADGSSMDSYGCDLDDLPLILLQQIAGQIIRWLHDEALIVGMKVSRDFLCLYLELDQGDMLGLVARVDPDDVNGCISWWMIMEDGMADDGKFSTNSGEYKNRRFLGHLSLEALYSMLMDLVNVSTNSLGGS